MLTESAIKQILQRIHNFFSDRKRHTAKITCEKCQREFETSIHPLSEAIDVYCDWVDECDGND
jgi:transcription elongation factor Elf1